MIPILFEATETAFDSNGIGRLTDATVCTVTEERNGSFELEMQYPATGSLYKELAMSRIILAVPGDGRTSQPFRIYKISRPINGIVTVSAQHISYQLSYIPVMPFSPVSSANAALMALKSNAAEDCPYTFWSDNTTAGIFSVTVPQSLRSSLGGQEGSVLDIYGGEYEWDRYMIRLHAARGSDRGVTLRYGKNITDITQEENISSTKTGICPYWAGSDGVMVTLPEKVISADNVGNYPYPLTVPHDMSGEFAEPPTEAQLREAAQKYIKEAGIGVPSVSITVSFAALWQTEQYKDIAPLERVGLCDIITVEFTKLGVSAKAKVVRTVYNVLKDRYGEIEIGDLKSSLADTIAEQKKEVTKKTSSSFLTAAIERATAWITGANGGYMAIHKDGNSQPYEILIMDTPDITTARKVWRWNQGGLGYSSNGYNGPYETAITQGGEIVADFITAGVLQGIRVIADEGRIAGWDISSRALYKDYKVGNTVYRVYIQSPQSATDWTFSTQISTDGGKTFSGKFYVRADGYVYANDIHIAGGTINVVTNEEDKSVIDISYNGSTARITGGAIEVKRVDGGSVRLLSTTSAAGIAGYWQGALKFRAIWDNGGSSVRVSDGGGYVSAQCYSGDPSITMAQGGEQATMDYDKFYNASLS